MEDNHNKPARKQFRVNLDGKLHILVHGTARFYREYASLGRQGDAWSEHLPATEGYVEIDMQDQQGDQFKGTFLVLDRNEDGTYYIAHWDGVERVGRSKGWDDERSQPEQQE